MNKTPCAIILMDRSNATVNLGFLKGEIYALMSTNASAMDYTTRIKGIKIKLIVGIQ